MNNILAFIDSSTLSQRCSTSSQKCISRSYSLKTYHVANTRRPYESVECRHIHDNLHRSICITNSALEEPLFENHVKGDVKQNGIKRTFSMHLHCVAGVAAR